jgi:hypothetical protein
VTRTSYIRFMSGFNTTTHIACTNTFWCKYFFYSLTQIQAMIAYDLPPWDTTQPLRWSFLDLQHSLLSIHSSTFGRFCLSYCFFLSWHSAHLKSNHDTQLIKAYRLCTLLEINDTSLGGYNELASAKPVIGSLVSKRLARLSLTKSCPTILSPHLQQTHP